MNWWTGLVLVLPLVISQTAMEVVLPRFMLLAGFLLVFLWFFFGGRARRLEITASRSLTQALGALGAAFLAILVVASLAAINKQEGLYRTLRYVLLLATMALFSATVAREEEKLLRLFKALALVLIIQSSVGILQFYGVAFESLPPQVNEKPFGLLANRTTFSSGLALLFPFCGYLAYAGNLRWKLISSGALWLGVYALIIGKTRSAWVAVAACLLASNLSVLLLRKPVGPSLIRGWLKGMCLFGLVTIVAAALATRIPNSEHINQDLRQRAISVLQLSERNTSVGSGTWRFHSWEIGFRMMRDHPFLGVGPGNFRVVVPCYGFYAEDNAPTTKQVTVPDHVHNVYLEMGAETGFAGLLIYLGLMGAAVLITVKVIARSDRNERRMLGIASLGAICIYSIDSVFSFPNEHLFHSLLLAFSVGIPVGIYERSAPAGLRERKTLTFSKSFLLLPTGVFLFCVYLGYVKGNFEDRMRRAMTHEKLKQYDGMLAEVEAGLTPLVTLSPRGFPLQYYAAVAHSGLGQSERALEAIKQARELNPWLLFTLDEMGRVNLQMKRWDAAIECFQDVLRIAPGYDVALHDLALAYTEKGMFKECCDTLARSHYQDNEKTIRLLALALAKLERYDKAADTLREGLGRFPDSTEMLELLAYVEYSHLDDMTNAYRHFQRLLVLLPNHPKLGEYTNVVNYLERRLGKHPPGQ